jgi:glutathione S-transferase
MSQYRLVYHNGRGRAEVTRLLFALAGQEYEDVRVERENWLQLKPTMPFGQLPVLEVRDGDNVTVVAQSNAINRLLATRFNLAGSTDLERARVDMAVDQLNDLFTVLYRWMYEQNEEVKAKLAETLFKETVPANVTFFEKLLEQNGTGYLVGNSLTWADVVLSYGLTYFATKRDEFLQNAPLVRALDEKVTSNERVAAWLAKRPETEF